MIESLSQRKEKPQMNVKPNRIIAPLLLVVSVFAVSAACLLYLTYPQLCVQHSCYTPCLGAFTCLFFLGFCSFRLPFVCLLTAFRFFALTLGTFHLLGSAPYYIAGLFFLPGALRGLLFAAFCRLCYLYGCLQHTKKNHLRYLVQYIGDYLFQCGMEIILCFLCKQIVRI